MNFGVGLAWRSPFLRLPRITCWIRSGVHFTEAQMFWMSIANGMPLTNTVLMNRPSFERSFAAGAAAAAFLPRPFEAWGFGAWEVEPPVAFWSCEAAHFHVTG